MIETRLMEYFLSIAKEESFTKAAAFLHVTQPTLSRQMQELEQRLGCSLFVRGKKKVLLTEEGRYFQRRAKEMLELMAAAESDLKGMKGAVSGEINLGCGETCYMDHVAARFAELRSRHPGVHLNLYSANTEAILERLDKGLLDVGLVLNPKHMDKYDYIHTGYSDRMGILVPRTDPLAERGCIEEACLRCLPLIVSSQTFSRYEEPSVPLQPEDLVVISYYNLINNAVYFTQRGLGYTLALDHLVDEKASGLVFLPIEPEIPVPWYLVCRKSGPKSPAVEAFWELFQNKD